MSDIVTGSEVSPPHSFTQFNLSPEVYSAIEKLGFTEPTPVQKSVIPILLEGKTDLIALANTGTGKTGAFGIPMIERITADAATQALVLCPTRELALQVAQNLQAFGTKKGIRVASIVGGESYRKQFDVLRTNPQIIVSTPGRLIDLMEQKKINLAKVQYFILDEADEMLSFGFKEALEEIWSALEKNGEEFNTWLFSATMNPSIQKLTHRYLNDPKEVYLQKVQDASRVESFAAVVYEEDKPDALCLALLQTKDFYGIIFAQTKQQVDQLEHKIRDCGFKVQSLHGDKTQAERTTTIKRLKNRDVHVLVATDVAARGLDIEDLTHVVNYDLPWDHETYTHRIGRTARAGKTGIVWNFCKPKDIRQMKNLERALKIKFKNLEIASVDKVRQQLTENWMQNLASFHPTSTSIDIIKKSAVATDLSAQMNEQTELWLARVLQYFHVGLPKNLKTPRVMDFERLDDRGPRASQSGSREGGRSTGFRGGRSSGVRYGSDRPRRSFDRGESSDRPRRSYDRSEGSDRPARSFDRGESSDRPARSFDRSEGSDRPARSFDRARSSDRPRSSGGGARGGFGRPARSESSQSKWS